jgi:nucleoside-diphosphate-sugar epimerase
MNSESAKPRTRLIIGCGYVGRRVAQRWLDEGDDVFALTRSESNSRELATLGVRPLVGDVTIPQSLSNLPEVETVLYAVGFDRNAGPTKREVYVDGLKNVLDVLAGRFQRFIYVSSTSVYGQCTGEIVDEKSPCQPTTESGQICRAAEELVEATARHSSTVILRLAGIYGPQRLLSRMESIRDGLALPGPKDAWLNLIHVDDAALAIDRIAAMTSPPNLLLVSDDEPIRREQYYATLADCMNAPEPQFDETAIARHTKGLNKRCDNSQLKATGVKLQFPTIKTGVRHAVAET